MAVRILVADDEIDDETNEISELPDMLRTAGYDVRTTAYGDRAYELVWEYNPDLIVLDIVFKNQPVDGVEICEAIRRNGSEIPILLVTAFMKETAEVLRGFEAGADDYVTRPRDNREIMARIRANLPPDGLVIGHHICLDRGSRRVWANRDGDWLETHLQPLQFELLDALVINTGRVVPTTTLKDRVWGKPVSDDVLSVYIHRLRKKLELDPGRPVTIETVRGFGYRLSGRLTRAGSIPPGG